MSTLSLIYTKTRKMPWLGHDVHRRGRAAVRLSAPCTTSCMSVAWVDQQIQAHPEDLTEER